jgi:hypothetical protein
LFLGYIFLRQIVFWIAGWLVAHMLINGGSARVNFDVDDKSRAVPNAMGKFQPSKKKKGKVREISPK